MFDGASKPARPVARFVPLTAPLLAFALAALERDRHVIGALDPGKVLRGVMGSPGLRYALLEGGYVLAAGGLVQHWPGLAEGWLAMTQFCRKRHLAMAARFTRLTLERVAGDPAYRRIEMRIRADAPWRESFARAIGFHASPVELEGWGPDGADYMLYAKVS